MPVDDARRELNQDGVEPPIRYPIVLTSEPKDGRGLLTFTPITGGGAVGELISVIQRLSFVRTVAEIQEIVRTAARRLTGADGATFVLRDGDRCYYADEDAISPLWKGQRFPMEICVSGWTMRNRRAAVIPDIYADDRVPHDAYRTTFVKSLAMVPIRQLDPLGAIGNYWATAHEPTGREIELLQALADSTAVALENARMYQELEEARLETLERLAFAAECRDDDTFQHTERVGRSASKIATVLGLGDGLLPVIQQAAQLHDIGKLSISDTVLRKPGRLTSAEYEHIKSHTTAGAAILAGSRSDVLRVAEDVALTHHEWWDGTGYPAGLSGEAIPISGRIVALADVFDALTHRRPYKQAWPALEAAKTIHQLAGRQFDPEVVRAFDELSPELLAA